MAFNSTKLINGLTVVTYDMPYLESVAINLIVKVGSRYEAQQEEGISHFLEHMAFKGTTSRSTKDIAEEFDQIGGRFNAYTSREYTVYYAKVLKNNIEQGLEIIADIIQNSSFKREDIKKEYEVILQEIAETNDDPADLGYEKFYSLAYAGQPMGKSILGTKESLQNLDKGSFVNYLSKYYRANNMYLAIAGNIKHEQVIALAERLFSGLKSADLPSYVSTKYHGGYAHINKKLEQTTFILGFESIPYTNMEDFYHAQLLSLIMGGGISSRLFQEIREKLGLVYSISSHNAGYLDSGLFSIYASTTHDKLLPLSDNIMNQILQLQQGITESELVRAKSQVKANIHISGEQSGHKSEIIGKNYAIFGKYLASEELISLIEQTAIADIQNISHRIFSTKPTLVIVGPTEGSVKYDSIVAKIQDKTI